MPGIKQCTKSSKSSKIKVSESGRQAVFLNITNASFRIIRADGCLYVGVISADYIICGPPGDLVVELKGSDVGHGLNQVRATMEKWITSGNASAQVAGLIVCARIPRFDSKIQRVKRSLAKEFGAMLHLSSRNQEHEFTSLF